MKAEKGEVSRAEIYSFFAAIFIQEPSLQTLAKQLQLLQLEAKYPLADGSALVETIRQEYFDCFYVPMSSSYTPPFESALSDYSSTKKFGPLAGPANQSVHSFYVATGFNPSELVVFAPLKEFAFPDHIGFELAFMAYLCLQEEAAYERGQQSEAQAWSVWQKGFLSEHLSRFLPQLTEALAERQLGFYAEAAKCASAWVQADLEELEDCFKEVCSNGQS